MSCICSSMVLAPIVMTDATARLEVSTLLGDASLDLRVATSFFFAVLISSREGEAALIMAVAAAAMDAADILRGLVGTWAVRRLAAAASTAAFLAILLVQMPAGCALEEAAARGVLWRIAA
ncbi:hypothetical protein RND81_11G020900 [Saponaria officinalis]|uniref:Uncharacterized protein n=1 Tax=Saponaria officinalis TaxID=3572 RepID=A0AAW1HGZ4_SAPOF